MSESKIPAASESIVIEISSRASGSTNSVPKLSEVKSEDQQGSSSSETTESDDLSSVDDSSEDDDDYLGDGIPSPESNNLVNPESRPSREKRLPERFSEIEPEAHRVQQAREDLAKTATGKSSRPKKKKTEKIKKKRKVSKRKLHQSITKHVAKKKEFKAKIQSLKDELAEKDVRINRLTDENIAHEKALQVILNDSLKLMNEANTFELPDDVVRTGFASIFARCKRWAKKWALQAFDNLSSDTLDELHRSITKPRTLGRLGSPRLMAAVRQNKIAPHIVVNALLNRCLSRQILDRPFGYLKDVESFGNIEKVLNHVAAIGSAGKSIAYLTRNQVTDSKQMVLPTQPFGERQQFACWTRLFPIPEVFSGMKASRGSRSLRLIPDRP